MPTTGRLVFATALSNRVADWIRSTNPVSEVVSTPQAGHAAGRAAGQGRCGEARRRAGTGCHAVGTRRRSRRRRAGGRNGWMQARCSRRSAAASMRPSSGLLARADALAVAALDQVDAAATSDAGTLAGLVEKHARLAGAEEVYIAVAPDLAADRRLNRVSKPMPLADRFAVRASVAYKGSWVRRTRTFAEGRQRRAAQMLGSRASFAGSKPASRSPRSFGAGPQTLPAPLSKAGWRRAASAAIRSRRSPRRDRPAEPRRSMAAFWC